MDMNGCEWIRMVCMFPRRMHREMTVRPEEIVSFFKMNLVWRWKFRHIGIGRCWKYLVLSTTDTRTDIESIERNWDCRMGDCLCTLPLRRITWRWATIQFGHWLQLTPRHCIHICAMYMIHDFLYSYWVHVGRTKIRGGPDARYTSFCSIYSRKNVSN